MDSGEEPGSNKDYHQEEKAKGQGKNKTRTSTKRSREEIEERKEGGGPAPRAYLRRRVIKESTESSEEEEFTPATQELNSEEEEELRLDTAGCDPEVEACFTSIQVNLREAADRIRDRASDLCCLYHERDKEWIKLKKYTERKERELDSAKLEISNLRNQVRRLTGTIRRANDTDWTTVEPLQLDSTILNSDRVYCPSPKLAKSINRCFDRYRKGHHCDWLDYYLEVTGHSENNLDSQVSQVGQGLDRVQKFYQAIEDNSDDHSAIKEIIGLTSLENNFVGLRTRPISVEVTVEPRLLPGIGEVIVLRRETEGEEVGETSEEESDSQEPIGRLKNDSDYE